MYGMGGLLKRYVLIIMYGMGGLKKVCFNGYVWDGTV